MYKFKIYDYFKLFLISLDRGDGVRSPVLDRPIRIRYRMNRIREFRRFHRPMERIGNPRKTRLTICAIYTHAYCPLLRPFNRVTRGLSDFGGSPCVYSPPYDRRCGVKYFGLCHMCDGPSRLGEGRVLFNPTKKKKKMK